jgi:hypothetical protein
MEQDTTDQNTRRSRIVSLVLIGTVAVFFGFKSCYTNGGSYSSTQPSSYGGSHYSGSHYFWSSGRSSSGSSSGVHSGTSRGGFGASGHAAGS